MQRVENYVLKHAPDSRKKISVNIPLELYEQIEANEYYNTTDAVVEGLLLLLKTEKESVLSETVLQKNVISDNLEQQLEALKAHNTFLQTELENSHKEKLEILHYANQYGEQIKSLINQNKIVMYNFSVKRWWEFWK